MSKLIITGATGTAGSAVLTQALASPLVSKVTILTRRPAYESSEKLHTILLPSDEHPKGFAELSPAVLDLLKDHDACIWAQGISQLKVKEDEYISITHDYPVHAAKSFAGLGSKERPFRFIYVSGEGVSQDGSGRQLFSRVKGRTEKEIAQLESDTFKPLSIRPGGILPTEHHRARLSFMDRQQANLGGALSWVYPKVVIESADLGKVLVNLATGSKGWEMMTEEGVIRMTGLKHLASQL